MTNRKNCAQAWDNLFDVTSNENENEDFFSTPDDDIFENLDISDLTLPAEGPLDLLAGKSDGCNNFQAFGRIRVRSDGFCDNDQSFSTNDDDPLIDLNQILARPREGFKTQEAIVNFFCPAEAFQGILDIPVCTFAENWGATPVTTPVPFFASIFSKFSLYHITYAVISKLILVCF